MKIINNNISFGSKRIQGKKLAKIRVDLLLSAQNRLPGTEALRIASKYRDLLMINGITAHLSTKQNGPAFQFAATSERGLGKPAIAIFEVVRSNLDKAIEILNQHIQEIANSPKK